MGLAGVEVSSERANLRRAVPTGLLQGKVSAIGAMMSFQPMEVAMIRFLGGRSLAALVLTLGLGVLGCGESPKPAPKDQGKEGATKAQEQVEKQREMMMKSMKDKMKDKMKEMKEKAGGAGGGAGTDKDKEKPKEGAKDKE